MATLFPIDVFEGFGSTAIVPKAFPQQFGHVPGNKPKALRQGVRERAPKLPGVYGMLGKNGELIYVGKAKSLRLRLMSYFRKSRDYKAGKILRHARTIVWETVPDEFAALVRELELIRHHRPRFNVIGIPGRRRYRYLCLGRAPAPYVYSTTTLTKSDLNPYGPFVSAYKAREAAKALNDWFKLRDCSQSQKMHFRMELELFPSEYTIGCLRGEIDLCTAPCAAQCSVEEYAQQTAAVKQFLNGNTLDPIEQTTQQMQAAAAQMQFERAMVYRDRLEHLTWVNDRLNWLRRAREENTFIFPVPGTDSRDTWYFIVRGQVRGAVLAPRAGDCGHAQEQIEELYKSNRSQLMPTNQVDHVLLVASWFRKHPDDKKRILSPRAAKAKLKGLSQG